MTRPLQPLRYQTAPTPSHVAVKNETHALRDSSSQESSEGAT